MATGLEFAQFTPVGGSRPRALRPSDDPSVVAAARSGDARAFSLIVEDTWQSACAVAARAMQRRPDDLEVRGLASEAFVSLCGIAGGRPVFLAGFDPSRRTLRGFLHVVVAARVRDLQRRETRRKSRTTDLDSWDRENSCTRAERRALEARLDLLRVASRASSACREALLVLDLLGEPLEDAAPVPGRPPRAVASPPLERARERVRCIARQMAEHDRWDA